MIYNFHWGTNSIAWRQTSDKRIGALPLPPENVESKIRYSVSKHLIRAFYMLDRDDKLKAVVVIGEGVDGTLAPLNPHQLKESSLLNELQTYEPPYNSAHTYTMDKLLLCKNGSIRHLKEILRSSKIWRSPSGKAIVTSV